MKAAISRLFHRFDRQVIEREIEEELRFHLELLTEQHLEQDMSLAEAKDAALKRFGNVEQIKDQCVEISRSNRLFFSCVEVFSHPGFRRWSFGACSGHRTRRHANWHHVDFHRNNGSFVLLRPWLKSFAHDLPG